MINGIQNKLVYVNSDAFKIKYRIVSANLKDETVVLTKADTEGKIRFTASWNEISYVDLTGGKND